MPATAIRIADSLKARAAAAAERAGKTTRSRGYIALCRFVASIGCVASIDTVFVLALRGQRESGHRRGH